MSNGPRLVKDLLWRPNPVPVIPLGPLGCTLSYHDLHNAGYQNRTGRAWRIVQRWAQSHQPERLTLNLRPGPPCWLAFVAIDKGIPFDAVVAGRQLERADPEFQDHLLYLWHSATTREVVGTVHDRDRLIGERVRLLTLHDLGLDGEDPKPHSETYGSTPLEGQ